MRAFKNGLLEPISKIGFWFKIPSSPKGFAGTRAAGRVFQHSWISRLILYSLWVANRRSARGGSRILSEAPTKILDQKTFLRWVIVFSILLIACQGVQRTVAPEDRISLRQGGPHTGIWESNTILLEYQYYKLSAELKLSVQAKVKTKVRYDGIKVHVLFVDAAGMVLVSKEVAVYRMDNTFEIPPETTFISFQANTYRRPQFYRPPTHR
jgi:hypothetical protein